MFYRSDRGRRDPHFLPIRDYEDPIRLDEGRFDAWAMALGQDTPQDAKPRGRPHRGMLPDVDLSRSRAGSRAPGLIARLFRLFAGRKRGEAAPADESGTGDARHSAKPSESPMFGFSNGNRTPRSLTHRPV